MSVRKELTGSFTMESKKCEKCKNRSICDKKELELCAYTIILDISDNMAENVSQSFAQLMERETMLVNDGHGNMMRIYKDEIEKQIYKNMNVCQLNLEYGA